MDREAWCAAVHGVTKSKTQLRDYAGMHIIYSNRHTNKGILLTCLLLLKYNHNAHFIQQSDQIANMRWIRDSNDLQQTKFIPEKKNTYFYVIEYIKAFDCVDHNKRFCQSIQLLSRVQLFANPYTAAQQASLSITNSQTYSNSCPLSR